MIIITDGRDDGSNASADRVLDALQINQYWGIPIYIFIYPASAGKKQPDLQKISDESNGGLFIKTKTENSYEKLDKNLQNQILILAELSSKAADTVLHRVQLDYIDPNGKIISDWKKVRFVHHKQDVEKDKINYMHIGAGLLVLILFIISLFFISRKRQVRQPTDHFDTEAEADEFQDKGDIINMEKADDHPAPLVEIYQQPVVDEGKYRDGEASFCLIEIKGATPGREYLFELDVQGIYLGRSLPRVPLEDNSLGGDYAVIHYSNDYFILYKANDENQVFLNGVPVSDKNVLRDGDLIRVGRTTLRFRTV